MLISVIIIIALTGLDQLTKHLATVYLAPVGAMPFIPGVMELRYVLNGYVVDFFATTFMNFAVFNVADCFVCVGAALFVIAVLRQELNAKKEQKAGTDENA